MPRHPLAVPILALALSAACATPRGSAVPSSVATAPEPPLSPEALRRDLLAIADDSMRGRETGTPDALRAARYLASRLRAMGLEPAGDSLYLQRVPLQRERFTPASRIEVRSASGATALRLGTDVAPLINLGEGVPPTRRVADGELVFAGYGLTRESGGRDDLAGLDLAGRVVVVVNGAPPGSDSASRERLESQAAISTRLAAILPRGPAAVVVLLAGKGRELFEQVAPELQRGVTLRSVGPELPEAERTIPLLLLGTPVAGSPLLPAGWPADDRAQRLEGRRLVAQLAQVREPIVEYNVVGVVPGRDPALRSTYVAYGAHYDHIGIQAPVAGDSIANGADDDGSGSVALLAIAQSLQEATVRPRRSSLFVWHVGEEKGLLGSSWFVDHPTVPIDSIVAHLNADMLGRNVPGQLYLIGPRVMPNNLGRRLGAVVDSVNAAMPSPFTFDRRFDAADHPEHLYERSDHFNYARKGIPVAFFTSGLHDDYHKPSDEVQRIDFGKLSRAARLLLETGRAVGDGMQRPRE